MVSNRMVRVRQRATRTLFERISRIPARWRGFILFRFLKCGGCVLASLLKTLWILSPARAALINRAVKC